MTRHAIDDALLAAHRTGKRSGEQPSAVRIGIDDPYSQAKATLLAVIGEASQCRSVWSKGFGFSTVFGFTGDLASVELLYTSLLLQARSAMVRAGDQGKRARSRSYRRSFLLGFADRIGRRLEEAASSAVADAVEERGSAFLPVLADRSCRVEEFCNEAFPDVTENRISRADWAGWASGVAAADAAVIARGPSIPDRRRLFDVEQRITADLRPYLSETQRAVSLSRMPLLGTRELGRGVVVGPGRRLQASGPAAPEWSWAKQSCQSRAPWCSCYRTRPWMERQPVVIELMAEPSLPRAPECSSAPVYTLSPRLEFTRERLHYLVWANNYDARSGELVWRHGRRAARFFAEQGVCVGGPADISLLSEGTPLFVDGGPFLPPVSVGGIGVVHRWNVEAGSLERLGDEAPSSELAPDQLAAVQARCRRCSGDRTGRLGEDAGSHRTPPAPRQGPPGPSGGGDAALAFNTKAAEEMRERCAELLGPDGPHIRTLNSVGLWICNEFGRAGRLRTIDEVEVRDPPAAAVRDPSAVQHRHRPAVHRCALEHSPRTRAPRLVEEAIPDAVGIAEGFDRYRSALADAGLVDFDEQIYRAIEILVSQIHVRPGHGAGSAVGFCSSTSSKTSTPAHMLLIRLLCGRRRSTASAWATTTR